MSASGSTHDRSASVPIREPQTNPDLGASSVRCPHSRYQLLSHTLSLFALGVGSSEREQMSDTFPTLQTHWTGPLPSPWFLEWCEKRRRTEPFVSAKQGRRWNANNGPKEGQGANLLRTHLQNPSKSKNPHQPKSLQGFFFRKLTIGLEPITCCLQGNGLNSNIPAFIGVFPTLYLALGPQFIHHNTQEPA